METFFYVGTYTQPIHFGTGEVLLGKGEGIYCIALDHDAGTARVVHVNPFSAVRGRAFSGRSAS